MARISIRLLPEDAQKLDVGEHLTHDAGLVVPKDNISPAKLELMVFRNLSRIMQLDNKIFNVKRYSLNSIDDSYYIIPRE